MAAAALALLVAGGPFEAARGEPAGPVPRSVSERTTASERAAATGEPVEILSERTERSQLFANPSGTFTLEQSTMPVRVETPEGWRDLDPTLERGADGLIRPRMAAIGMAFSGGGYSAPLVTLTKDGVQVGLHWPLTLPPPVLDGRTLTYPTVRPGVDLKITVDVDSFTQVLIAQTPAAARRLEFEGIRLNVATPSLSLVKSAGGGVDAIDLTGDAIFEAAQPLMWDSSGNGAAKPGALDRTAFPVEGDTTSAMSVSLGPDYIFLKPSLAMIDDPATVYPLHFDPGFSGKRSGHAMIDRAYPSSSYWNWSADQAVGYQNFDRWSHKRLFFQFYIAEIAGANVTRAVFRANQVYSASCTRSEIEAWETSRFTPGVTWNNASGSNVWLREVANFFSEGSGRPGCETGKVLEFGVTGLLDTRVGLRANYVYLGLRAADETNPMVWKRLTANSSLGIEYNFPPERPGAEDLKIGRSNHELACVTSTTGYPTTGGTEIDLRAFLADRDHAKGQAVFGEFEVWIPGDRRVFWGRSAALVPPREFSPTVKPNLPDGVYWWHVRVSDGISTSLWSPSCFFRVDTRYPPPPRPVLVTPAEACPPVEPPEQPIEDPCYRIGQVLTFDIVAQGEPATRFGWSVNVPEPMATVPAVGGQSARVSATLTNFGPTRLYVWSWDQADHISDYGFIRIHVIDSIRTGGWPIDEGSGSVLNDTLGSGVNTPMTKAPSVTWGAGDDAANVPTDRSVFTNGATDGTGGTAATTANDIVDTSQSFAVTARVKPSPTYTTKQIVVSEDRGGVSGFMLGMTGQSLVNGEWKITWAFGIADPNNPATEQFAVATVGHEGDWVHLTGVYNAASRALELYVDGVRVGLRWMWTTKQAIDADGPFRIGRAIDGNAAKHYLRGYIDDVAVFNGFINAHTVRRLYLEKEPAA